MNVKTSQKVRPGRADYAPYEPPKVKATPVFRQVLSDIDYVATRFHRSSTASEAVSYSDSMSATREELASMLLSTAATASLVGYLRDDPWRLEIVGENSADGLILLGFLHDARREFQRLEAGFADMFTQNDRKNWFRSSIALSALSLDAVSVKNVPLFCRAARMELTGDPQGDAQFEAEELDREGRLPLNKATL